MRSQRNHRQIGNQMLTQRTQKQDITQQRVKKTENPEHRTEKQAESVKNRENQSGPKTGINRRSKKIGKRELKLDTEEVIDE